MSAQGSAAALVTNPIHKDSLYRAGFRHPGHTEYLAELAGNGLTPVMMLVCPQLRVVPVTIHLRASPGGRCTDLGRDRRHRPDHRCRAAGRFRH